MAYTNSSMVAYKRLSPNHSGQRTHSIDRITPHCVVGQCTAEGLGDWFAKSSTKASSNYGIDKDGRVGLYVEEKNRSWCSSSNANDQRAVTIECASDTSEPYAFRDVVYQKLIVLCTDICKRSLTYVEKLISIIEKWKLTAYDVKDSGDAEPIRWYRVRKSWADSKSQKGAYKILENAKKCADQNPGYKVFDVDGNVVYEPKAAEPAVKVPFLVKVSISDLNIRKGPGTDYDRVQFIPIGVYTIMEAFCSSTKGRAGYC